MPLRGAALLLLLVVFAAQGSGSRLLRQAVGTGAPQASPPSDGNLSGELQGCTDIPPPGDKTCAELKASGDCNTAITTSRNYCAATCVRCIPPTGTPTPSPAQPAQNAPAAEGSSLPSSAAQRAGPAAEPLPAGPAVESIAGTAGAPAAAAGPQSEASSTPESAAEALSPGPSPELKATSSTPEDVSSTPAPAFEAAGQGSSQAPASEPSGPPATSAAISSVATALKASNGTAPTAPQSSNASSPIALRPGAPAVPGSGEVFEGDGTAYSEAVNNTGKGFACSFRYINDWASTHFAAVNLPQWDSGLSCGRCATVRCIDERCTTRNKDVTVMVVDQCPECKHGDLDFSIPIYREITGMWPHRLRVQWQWSDCSPFVNGTIKMYPKDGINPFWQAFYFANMKYPLASVTLNGKVLTRSQFGFFQHPAPLGEGPHKIEFEADNGRRVTAFSDDPLKEQDLGVQF